LEKVMMSKSNAAILALALFSTLSLAQGSPSNPSPQPDLSRVLGVWRGQMDGLPAVSLVLTDEGGSLSGAVLFYLHVRKTVNDPYTLTPGLPEPMFHMRINGNTLSFQVSHRRAHPPKTLSDPPVSFHMTLTGSNQAVLVNQNEMGHGEIEKGAGLVMVRSDD
jgi:hypothetical protein